MRICGFSTNVNWALALKKIFRVKPALCIRNQLTKILRWIWSVDLLVSILVLIEMFKSKDENPCLKYAKNEYLILRTS